MDASHEDQQDRVAGVVPAAASEKRIRREEQQKGEERLNRILAPVMVHLGIERLQGWLSPDASPPPFGLSRSLVEEFSHLDQQLKTRQAAAAETTAMKESAKQARSGPGSTTEPLDQCLACI